MRYCDKKNEMNKDSMKRGCSEGSSNQTQNFPLVFHLEPFSYFECISHLFWWCMAALLERWRSGRDRMLGRLQLIRRGDCEKFWKMISIATRHSLFGVVARKRSCFCAIFTPAIVWEEAPAICQRNEAERDGKGPFFTDSENIWSLTITPVQILFSLHFVIN